MDTTQNTGTIHALREIFAGTPAPVAILDENAPAPPWHRPAWLAGGICEVNPGKRFDTAPALPPLV